MSEVRLGQARAGYRFSVSSRGVGDGILVALSGEVDLTTAPTAESELRRAEESHDLILLDLREVSFMDSTGLRMLIAADQRMRERGGRFVVVEGSPQVHRLLELTHVPEQIEVIKDPSELTDGAP